MNIAILKDSVCVDAAVFDDVETALEFFESGVWPEADGVVALPDGFGIGDSWTVAGWVKREPDTPDEPEPEPQPDYAAFIAGLYDALQEAYANE